MDFEKLLEQEARKAARQDYEEVTEKTKDYSYKYSKAFIQKMNAMIREEKKKGKKEKTMAYFAGGSDYFDIECRNCSSKR